MKSISLCEFPEIRPRWACVDGVRAFTKMCHTKEKQTQKKKENKRDKESVHSHTEIACSQNVWQQLWIFVVSETQGKSKGESTNCTLRLFWYWPPVAYILLGRSIIQFRKKSNTHAPRCRCTMRGSKTHNRHIWLKHTCKLKQNTHGCHR